MGDNKERAEKTNAPDRNLRPPSLKEIADPKKSCSKMGCSNMKKAGREMKVSGQGLEDRSRWQRASKRVPCGH